jgi:hypothetical protein
MGQGNSNYNYIGSGTPDYYGNFSTQFKETAGEIGAISGAIALGAQGVAGVSAGLAVSIPFLAPFFLGVAGVAETISGVASGIGVASGVAEGLIMASDTTVGVFDLKGDINRTIERDNYPDRYQSYGNQRNTIEKSTPSTKLGGVNFNNNTFGDQLSEKASSSTDRYGNVMSSVNSVFNQYKGVTTI